MSFKKQGLQLIMIFLKAAIGATMTMILVVGWTTVIAYTFNDPFNQRILSHDDLIKSMEHHLPIIILICMILAVPELIKAFSNRTKLTEQDDGDEERMGDFGSEMLDRIAQKQIVYMDSWKAASFRHLEELLEKELKELTQALRIASKDEIHKKAVSTGTILYFIWAKALEKEQEIEGKAEVKERQKRRFPAFFNAEQKEE